MLIGDLLDVSEMDLDQVEAELEATMHEINRQRWAKDPVAWAREKLGETLWSGQIEILEAVRDNRKTAVATCHEIGKSYGAALLAAWWIDSHPLGKAYVVTTAPTNPQVRIILWKEIGRAHQRGQLPGRVNQTEWKAEVNGQEESIAIGRKPNDYSPTAFQGVHAPFVLVIIDEANGVRGPLHDAIDSITANDNSKVLMIGNPDEPVGEFYEACKPNSGFKVIHISAFDSPNFTGEELPEEVLCQLIGRLYVEEKRQKWAKNWVWEGNRVVCPEGLNPADTHPFWQSKVLGQFPTQSTGSLIPLSWIRAAQERELPLVGAHELGLDVGASEDGDPSCLGERHGQHFRVLYEDREPDTMKTTGKLIQHLNKTSAACAKVDYIGVGRGVVDRSREQNLPVYPISVGESSTVYSCRLCKHEWDQSLVQMKRQVSHIVRCPKCGSDQIWPVFANLLSQLWWSVRGIFEHGEIDIDPQDEELAEELMTIHWKPNSKGQTEVFYSKDAPSPNRADALLMTFAPVAFEQVKSKSLTSAATW